MSFPPKVIATDGELEHAPKGAPIHSTFTLLDLYLTGRLPRWVFNPLGFKVLLQEIHPSRPLYPLDLLRTTSWLRFGRFEVHEAKCRVRDEVDDGEGGEGGAMEKLVLPQRTSAIESKHVLNVNLSICLVVVRKQNANRGRFSSIA